MNRIEDNSAFQLLFVVQECVKMIESSKKLPKDGEIEVLIFNSILAKNFLRQSNPSFFQKISDEYSSFFLGYMLELGLDKKVSNILSFLNKRTEFYMEELEKASQLDDWLPSKIYNLFYENPLSTPSASTDFIQLMEFQYTLASMGETLKDTLQLFNDN